MQKFQINITLKSGETIEDVCWDDALNVFTKRFYSNEHKIIIEARENYDLSFVQSYVILTK